MYVLFYLYRVQLYLHLGILAYIELYIFTNNFTWWIDNVGFGIENGSLIQSVISRIISWGMRRRLIYKLSDKRFFRDLAFGDEVMLELVRSCPHLLWSTEDEINELVCCFLLIYLFDFSKSCKLLYSFLTGIFIGVYGLLHEWQIWVEVGVCGWR